MKKLSALFLAALLTPFAASAALINGSFETPGIGSGFAPVGPGDPSIVGWTVIGSHVLLIHDTYTEPGLAFSAQHGDQSLDLTGLGNAGFGGVQQSVATTAGATYTLTFFVGNQDDSKPNYTLDSAVNLFIDGSLMGTFVNPNSTPGDLNWLQFTFPVIAASNSTTIAFVSATPPGDNMAGLDNVSFTAVPEPGTLALMGAAFAALGLSRRRKDA
ncbi:MAG TPA: DUF642 domain-containing protein [Burkholderiales bacterium]|nr:DUF642 domain-containing protein [Burkholderiales bacterium]